MSLSATRIDLYLETRILGRGYAFEHVLYVAAARRFPESVGIERIERDINSPDAGSGKVGRVFREPGAVGRERQFLKVVRLEMP
jgi:hypothetical protein